MTSFDPEGHLSITPAEVFACASRDAARLINDVLWQGTPRTFDTHDSYRNFVNFVAGELSVHPSCIVFRGSTRLGFSMTPRSGKIWMQSSADSDVDLAIVDPDHFHFLDAEIRKWERTQRMFALSGREIRAKFMNLERNRSAYCYRHEDLPDTPLVETYKTTMLAASLPKLPGCGRDVTAFFYRDWWSLHAREERDIRDVVRRTHDGNLPKASNEPRSFRDYGDDELTTLDGSLTELCLSEMPRITDAGLSHLSRLTGLRKLWLDDMEGITDAGLWHVGKIASLMALSVCSRTITDRSLLHLYGLKNLTRLHYDRSGQGITGKGLLNLKKALPGLTIRYR